MALTSSVVVVTTSATLLAAADRNRTFIAIANSTGTHIHVGGVGVSVETGFRLDPNDEVLIQNQHQNDHTAGQAWYAVSNSGTQNVGVTLASENAST